MSAVLSSIAVLGASLNTRSVQPSRPSASLCSRRCLMRCNLGNLWWLSTVSAYADQRVVWESRRCLSAPLRGATNPLFSLGWDHIKAKIITIFVFFSQQSPKVPPFFARFLSGHTNQAWRVSPDVDKEGCPVRPDVSAELPIPQFAQNLKKPSHWAPHFVDAV